ncbi:hypothetical protein K1719_019673 [Acacia pycnantha]|nr:hypothetical protein K1719_019673 [Acacia pycnantha]
MGDVVLGYDSIKDYFYFASFNFSASAVQCLPSSNLIAASRRPIGASGIWIGMIFGTLVQTVILTILTYKTDWDEQVILARSRVNKFSRIVITLFNIEQSGSLEGSNFVRSIYLWSSLRILLIITRKDQFGRVENNTFVITVAKHLLLT